MDKPMDPIYDKQYNQGFAFGVHPAFADCEDLSKCAKKYNNIGFKAGFIAGRMEYERLNGPLCDGLPKKILTPKMIENFELLGRIAFPLEAHGFSKYQVSKIQQHYRLGLIEFDTTANHPLFELLNKLDIQISR